MWCGIRGHAHAGRTAGLEPQDHGDDAEGRRGRGGTPAGDGRAPADPHPLRGRARQGARARSREEQVRYEAGGVLGRSLARGADAEKAAAMFGLQVGGVDAAIEVLTQLKRKLGVE